MDNQRILLIDDCRDMSADVICRHVDYGITVLKWHKWEILYLDYDMGDGYPTGIAVLDWLKVHPQYLPGKIIPISSNIDMRRKMQQVIKDLYEVAQ